MDKKSVKNFFRPTGVKIVLFIILLFYSFYLFVSPNSIIMTLLLLTPLYFAGIFALVLIFPYYYAIACALIRLFDYIKKSKTLIIAVILASFFLLGIDEPLLNATVNSPDYSCNVDSDCASKSIPRGLCPDERCVNNNWNYYNSRINNVFATSCAFSKKICSCKENKCVATGEASPVDLTLLSMQKRVRIDNAVCLTGDTSIIIRNMGGNITEGDLSVFIDDAAKTCSWSGMPVLPGNTATCTVNEGGYNGKRIKVSAPGNTDEVICS